MGPVVEPETLMEALVPVVPETVALTVASPLLTAVINPLLLTVRTLVLLLVQLMAAPVTGTLLACKKLALTVACCGSPAIILVLATATLTETGVKFVTSIFGPAMLLTAIYRGEAAAFQIRNSSMLPANMGSPPNSSRPNQLLNVSP